MVFKNLTLTSPAGLYVEGEVSVTNTTQIEIDCDGSNANDDECTTRWGDPKSGVHVKSVVSHERITSWDACDAAVSGL